MNVNWEVILIFAIMVEGVVTVITRLYDDSTPTLHWYQAIQWKMILAILVSVGVAFAARLKLFDMVGFPLQPEWLDYAFSGFLTSRGAAYVYELMRLVREARVKVEAEVTDDQRIGLP